MRPEIRIGTAGWGIPKTQAAAFPGSGTHLQRYARRLRATEINSSFYRPHRPASYTRWAASVPADFRFAVKIPKEVTHVRRLSEAEEPLRRFMSEVRCLGEKLGPLLIQLPPSLVFDGVQVEAFFETLREGTGGDVVCEPRHPSWFTDAVDTVLRAYRVARVAADPAVAPNAGRPGGWRRVAYWRLHGSPRTYYSSYARDALDALEETIKAAFVEAHECWCIFDNTAAGEATANALSLLGSFEPSRTAGNDTSHE